MIKLRTARIRLRRAAAADSGISIVEALVAALIFMIIAVGVAQSMVSAVRLSGDGQHRTVALNVASTELDRLEALNNPYAISSTTSAVTSTIDGITYSLTRSASWVNINGNEISCSAQSGNFQLLRVRVRVDWAGRMSGVTPVTLTTTYSPQNTILSPTTATLFISVNKADGTPNAGVQPTVVSTTTGKSITAPATNADGCSYVSGIKADTYQVRVSTSGGIDNNQNATGVPQTDPTTVTAGSSVPVLFAYDQAATVNATYGPSTGSPLLPTNLYTTYSATSQTAYFVQGTPTSVSLFPVASGYSIVAGKLTAASGGYPGCLSTDPANWTAGSVSGTNLKAGIDPANTPAAPGGSSSINVAMGTANVTTTKAGYIQLTSTATSTPGDPGCPNNASGAQQTYQYKIPASGTFALAIPYGTWASSFSTASNGTFTSIPTTPTSNAYTTSASPTFSIDPRTT